MDIVKALEAYDSFCLSCSDHESIRVEFDDNFLPVYTVNTLAGSDLELGLNFKSSLPFVGLGIDFMCGRKDRIRKCLVDLYYLENNVLVYDATASIFVLNKLYGYNPKFGLDVASLCYRDYFLWNVFMSQVISLSPCKDASVTIQVRGMFSPKRKGRLGYLFAYLRLTGLVK